MSRTANRVAISAIIIMLLSVFSKFIGFIREMVIAAFYGAGMETDAFFLATSISSTLFASLGTSLNTTFIPMYTSALALKGRRSANRFACNTVNISLIISLLFILASLIFTPPIIKIFAPGFTGEVFALTVKIARVIFPTFIFVVFAYIATGILQSHEHFVAPALIGVPYSLTVIIVTLLLGREYGIYSLAWASFFAALIQALIQLPALKGRFRYIPVLDLRDPGIRTLGVMLVPILFGTAVEQVNTLVDRILASGLAEGSISAITYSNRLLGFASRILVASVTTAIYPVFSRLAARKAYDDLSSYLSKTVNAMLMILIPITAGTIILSRDIVSIAFERGAFDRNAVHLTSFALLFYSLGISAFGIRTILNRAFFSLKDTNTPMLNGVAAVVLNIILNIILVRYMGLGGLGLATSLSGIFGAILLIISLKSKLPSMRVRPMAEGAAKAILSSLLMGVAVWAVRVQLDRLGLYPAFILSAFAGAAVYYILMKILKVRELDLFIELFRKELTRVKANKEDMAKE